MLTRTDDHYAALGVVCDAEPVVITGAYRALARAYHPDVNPAGEARMKRINEAYATLSDPVARSRYDLERRPAAPAPPPAPPPAAEVRYERPRQPAPAEPRPRRCEVHPYWSAVARCPTCGLLLCEVCADALQPDCANCQASRAKARMVAFWSPSLAVLLAGVWLCLSIPAHRFLLACPIAGYLLGASFVGWWATGRVIATLRSASQLELWFLLGSWRWRAIGIALRLVVGLPAGALTTLWVIFIDPAVWVGLRGSGVTDSSLQWPWCGMRWIGRRHVD